MRFLLDTHALTWFVEPSQRLPESVRLLIQLPQNDVFVSPASAYEISFKFGRGMWPEMELLAKRFEVICDQAGFVHLPITANHAREAGAFQRQHRDPFDRLLAAQAIVENMAIISIDEKLDLFPIKRRWG